MNPISGLHDHRKLIGSMMASDGLIPDKNREESGEAKALNISGRFYNVAEVALECLCRIPLGLAMGVAGGAGNLISEKSCSTGGDPTPVLERSDRRFYLLGPARLN